MKRFIYVVNSYSILSFEPDFDLDIDEQVLRKFGKDFIWFADFDDALEYLFNGIIKEF